MQELESSIVAVLERQGPQPKHALVKHLNEGRVVEIDHAELRGALNDLERTNRIVWSGGVVRLPGSQRVPEGDDHTEQWRGDDDGPWHEERDPEEWIDERLSEPEDADRLEGPDVPIPGDQAAGWFVVATEWTEVRAVSPEAAADSVLSQENEAAPNPDRVLAIERDLVEQFERTLVTRRVEE